MIKKPWPSMMRTIYKDPDRYKVYWNTIPNCYTAGDVCRKDQDGYLWFMGRADDAALWRDELLEKLYNYSNELMELALGGEPPCKCLTDTA